LLAPPRFEPATRAPARWGDAFPGHRRDCGSGIASSSRPPSLCPSSSIPSGIRTRARGLAPLETVKGVTLGPDLDKRDLKRPTAGGTVTCWGVPPQASRGGACSGRTPEASDSTLARRVSRFQPLPRDPWQVSMNGNGSGQRLWNCLLGRTPWRHGDLRPLLFARGMIRADRSTTCPPDGVLAKDRVRSKGRRVQWEIDPRGQEPDVP
jgi:hypothetical protein